MKIINRIILTVAILLISLYTFAACGDNDRSVSGKMTLVIGTETPCVYDVDLEGIEITEGVLSIIKHLNETEGLEYNAEQSIYGSFLTKVGALEQNITTGSYIYIFTSVKSDFDVTAYASSISYEGNTLFSSGVGISDMIIETDCIIYIGIHSF